MTRLEAPTWTGFVTGMTNTTRTIGGAIASSISAVALAVVPGDAFGDQS